ncbi:MAG: Holliday junction branch migration protein RuvA [Acidobacteriota bacterium]
MIGRLTGEIVFRKPNFLVIDVNGIGYDVSVPLSTYFKIEDGKPVSLEIYTHLKEDSINLYGFLTREEKLLFERLISISGIGPRLAINILSGIDFMELVRAIRGGDSEKLKTIPGIGKKIAERIALELKDKLAELPVDEAGQAEDWKWRKVDPGAQALFDDAISALSNLGFPRATARKAVEESFASFSKDHPEELPVFEDLFRRSLKQIMIKR